MEARGDAKSFSTMSEGRIWQGTGQFYSTLEVATLDILIILGASFKNTRQALLEAVYNIYQVYRFSFLWTEYI